MAGSNLAIQQTDQDMSAARVSAVQMGYLEDAFVVCFMPGAAAGRGKAGGRRIMPIINRGLCVVCVYISIYTITCPYLSYPIFSPLLSHAQKKKS